MFGCGGKSDRRKKGDRVKRGEKGGRDFSDNRGGKGWEERSEGSRMEGKKEEGVPHVFKIPERGGIGRERHDVVGRGRGEPEIGVNTGRVRSLRMDGFGVLLLP